MRIVVEWRRLIDLLMRRDRLHGLKVWTAGSSVSEIFRVWLEWIGVRHERLVEPIGAIAGAVGDIIKGALCVGRSRRIGEP